MDIDMTPRDEWTPAWSQAAAEAAERAREDGTFPGPPKRPDPVPYEAQDEDRPARNLLAGLRNAAWLDRQTFPALAWHVPGVVPEGMSILAGAPKAGKSWMSLDIALAVASGGRALGRILVDRRPVLLLALEDGNRRLKARMRRLLPVGDLPEGLDYLTDVKPGLVVDTITAWLATLPKDGPAPLVILDTLGRAMPPAGRGESGYAHDYAFMASLKRTVDDWPGAALVLVHHTRKMGAEDFLDVVSGTNGIAGAADSVIVLSRRRHDAEGKLQVTGRDVDEAEYALTFDGQWTLDGGDLAEAARTAETRRETEGLGDDSTSIVTFIAQHPAGIGPKAIAEALGINEPKVKVTLGRLVESGRIDKAGRGVYVPVTSKPPVTSVTPLPSDDEGQGNDVTEVTPPPTEEPEAIRRPEWVDDPDNLTPEGFCRVCGGDVWNDLAPSDECEAFHRLMRNPAYCGPATDDGACDVCGEPLAAVLVAAGDTRHIGCEADQ